MLKLGIHCLIWTDKWSNRALELIDKARKIGFSAFEITMRDLEVIDPPRVRERLQANAIEGVAVTGIPKDGDITSPDVTIRRHGIEILKRTVKVASEMGIKILVGVIHSSWNKLAGRGPTNDEINYSADALREVAKFAQDFDVKMGIEAVNRYENYMINTARQGLCLVELIDEPNVGLHLDTYHMNIEEKNFYDPIIEADKKLFHVHLCENDRGIPGTGHVDWDGVFRALRNINYNGVASIESFLFTNPELASLTKIWRQLAPNGDIMAKEGLSFLMKKAKEHGLEVI